MRRSCPTTSSATLAAVRAKTREVAAAGLVPAVVGGDDSILFPAVAGVHDAVAGSLGIVHLDAHLDLLDESPAQGRFSQSSGMRRALELPRVSARHSVQVGTRSFNFPSSKRFIDEVGLTELPAALMARRGLDWTLARIREVVAGADHVFLSVDLDVLDPAHAPGVGWHEPGGLTSRDLLDLVVALAPSVRGFALNELEPDDGQPGPVEHPRRERDLPVRGRRRPAVRLALQSSLRPRPAGAGSDQLTIW